MILSFIYLLPATVLAQNVSKEHNVIYHLKIHYLTLNYNNSLITKNTMIFVTQSMSFWLKQIVNNFAQNNINPAFQNNWVVKPAQSYAYINGLQWCCRLNDGDIFQNSMAELLCLWLVPRIITIRSQTFEICHQHLDVVINNNRLYNPSPTSM